MTDELEVKLNCTNLIKKYTFCKLGRFSVLGCIINILYHINEFSYCFDGKVLWNKRKNLNCQILTEKIKSLYSVFFKYYVLYIFMVSYIHLLHQVLSSSSTRILLYNMPSYFFFFLSVMFNFTLFFFLSFHPN